MTDGFDSSMRNSILKEMGSIGAAHAATALEKMTGLRIEVKPTVTHRLSLENVYRVFSDAPEMQVGIYQRMTEGMNGCLVFFVPKGRSYAFVDLVIDLPEGTTAVLGEKEQSALRECGSIICASYMNAIAAMTGTTIKPTVSKLIFDQQGQVLEAILQGLFPTDTEVVLIENDFRIADKEVKGYFILVPAPGELQRLLSLMEALL